ncbi:transposase [Streptomyces mirabilis]|uniref:transposase n=1 Tax=Streptomyces mirabilis TaxID=68239 RepID=UPI0036DE0F89
MGSKQRTYTPEFREGAVRIVIETGRPIPEVAEELGVRSGTLCPSPVVVWAAPPPGRSAGALRIVSALAGPLWRACRRRTSFHKRSRTGTEPDARRLRT